ncbi:uncharacterized protein N7498_005866 [Penicillium cinerascens]|uniref:Uncharacterized protein n=1 Tax=Penicillium cinerascens TaxID=70096 RepID=A0A9W9MP88_9EURO|nr:uncharacterized protein N7498_005866 [Penicillium cinerascens]KAJ5204987.1 hypothetical protein N7498_005866 [Penicillium cinerascens]
MPAIPFPAELLEGILVHRNAKLIPGNATAEILEVVCAWPVSGQYGPGTRVLYYALAAACVFARKEEWIRNPCLAAVLLFPAVAAIHGIVLAALHRNGAVDMDVYGAFQLCTIGILTAPPTVRLSTTYFNNPGRDIIFLWTGLLLAGLLSLVVEFIRLAPTACPPDDPASIEWAATGKFSYNSNCSLVCSVANGPYSPLRQDAANNINVIPVPHELTFNTATLLAAACCIPAILLLVTMWIKILEKNWEKFSRRDREKEKPDESPIEGTNGATPNHMRWISDRIRSWLTLIEVPIFVAAVLFILIKGEMNFFSTPVRYQTEPIASIGQWAPIVGTGLGVVGSLYILLAADMEAEDKKLQVPDDQLNENIVTRCPRCDGCAVLDEETGSGAESSRSWQSIDEQSSPPTARTATQPSITTTFNRASTTQSEGNADPGGRKKVARALSTASRALAAKANSKFEYSGFEVQERNIFPTVPGEDLRNGNLSEFKNAYSTPQPQSRASSPVESIEPGSSNGQGTSKTPLESPKHLSLHIPQPTRVVTRQRHSNTGPSRGGPSEASNLQALGISYETSASRQRDLPEILMPDRQHASMTPSISDVSPTALTPGAQDTRLKIVVSEDQGGHS